MTTRVSPRSRPNVPIVAVTESRPAAAALALVWGVVAVTSAGPLGDPQSCVAAARAAHAVAAGALVTVVTSPDPDESDPTASVHVVRA